MYKYLILLSFYFFAICVSPAHAIDTILVNGKIITVDDRFAIVQALAIKDRRIVAAGSNAEVQKLATATTRVIDVKGRTVIPGLIDNHSHWVRAAEHDELRLDGVTSRKQALEMLLTGEFIDATTAKARGLVNRVVRPEDLDTNSEDHAADEWRYAAMSRPWIKTPRAPEPPKDGYRPPSDDLSGDSFKTL